MTDYWQAGRIAYAIKPGTRHIRPDAWTVVALRVRDGDTDAWDPVVPPEDYDAIIRARIAGRAVTAQRRGDGGRFELVARVVA